jgi:hypothetical protein
LLSDLGRAPGDEQGQSGQDEEEGECPHKARGEHLVAVAAVQVRAGGELGLVLGFVPLLAVPPGAAAVEVVTDLGNDKFQASRFTHSLVGVHRILC